MITPDAALSGLSQLYGFDLPPPEYQEYSVADFLNKRFHAKPVVGDRVALGQVQFVVRIIKGDRITAVGL